MKKFEKRKEWHDNMMKLSEQIKDKKEAEEFRDIVEGVHNKSYSEIIISNYRAYMTYTHEGSRVSMDVTTLHEIIKEILDYYEIDEKTVSL